MLLQLATTKFCCVTTFEVGGTIRATTLFNFERNNVAWKLKKNVARITRPLVSSVFVFHLHFDARLARLFLYSNQETPHFDPIASDVACRLSLFGNDIRMRGDVFEVSAEIVHMEARISPKG